MYVGVSVFVSVQEGVRVHVGTRGRVCVFRISLFLGVCEFVMSTHTHM